MTPRFPRPQIVLFDAVGTLIYPQPSVADVYAAAGRQHGKNIEPLEIRQRFPTALRKHGAPGPTNELRERQRWQAIVADLFALHPHEDVSPLFESLWEYFAQPSHWAVYPDVSPTLQWLRQRHIPVGIASNFDQRLNSICQTTADLAHLAPIFTSASVGYTKPSPHFYAVVQERLGLPPETIWLVGDDPIHDGKAPQEAGWRGWLICRDRPQRADQLSDLRELIPLLDD
jgi:putative hydrolase of the HAD superfamily